MDWMEIVEPDSKTGFLYSLWDEKLTVYEGTIHPNIYAGCSTFFGVGEVGKRIACSNTWVKANPNIYAGCSTFFGVGEVGKRIACSNKPGIVYKAVVWLPRRNDDKAKKILIGHTESVINELQEKIKNQMARIDMLKNEKVVDPK